MSSEKYGKNTTQTGGDLCRICPRDPTTVPCIVWMLPSRASLGEAESQAHDDAASGRRYLYIDEDKYKSKFLGYFYKNRIALKQKFC